MKRLKTLIIISAVLLALLSIRFTGEEKINPNENNTLVEVNRNYQEEIEYRNVSDVLERNLRIVVLGDSISSAYDLKDRKYAWPNRLERRLRDRGKDVEVVNLAEPATGVEEHADKFTSRGYEYDPNLILIQLSNEDFFDYEVFKDMQRENFSKSNISWEINDEKALNYHKQLWKKYVDQALSRPNSYKLGRYWKNLDRIDNKLDGDEKVYIIHSHSGYERVKNLEQFFRNYTEEKDWNYIDWRNFHKGEAEKSEVVLAKDNQHYNRKGNRIWEEKLFQILNDKKAFEHSGTTGTARFPLLN